MQNKVYVSVVALCGVSGYVLPMTLIWRDGRRFRIDDILEVRLPAAYEGVGAGERYKVRIRGKERYLYYEVGGGPSRWYVETREAQ